MNADNTEPHMSFETMDRFARHDMHLPGFICVHLRLSADPKLFARITLLCGLTLACGGADSLAQGYPTPGFDCANATSAQELRICRSPLLGELDGRQWYLAERVIKGARDQEAARSAVESWINQVRNACETDKCLADAYTARNAQLERDVAALPPLRPPPMPAGLPVPAAPPPALESKAAIEPPPISAPIVVAPAPAAPPKPAARLAPPEPVDSPSPWPWLVAASLIAALAVRWLLSARGAPTGKAPPGDRG
jgi:uncharacterized protein